MNNDTLAALKAEIAGYHLEISLYPSGGMISAAGCDECGTSETIMESAMWRDDRGQTFEEAKGRLKQKLGIGA